MIDKNNHDYQSLQRYIKLKQWVVDNVIDNIGTYVEPWIQQHASDIAEIIGVNFISSVSGTSPISATTTSGAVTITHAGRDGTDTTTTQTIGAGDSGSIVSEVITVDNYGHITDKTQTTTTITIPANLAAIVDTIPPSPDNTTLYRNNKTLYHQVNNQWYTALGGVLLQEIGSKPTNWNSDTTKSMYYYKATSSQLYRVANNEVWDDSTYTYYKNILIDINYVLTDDKIDTLFGGNN